jgi:hypothetical protein
LEMSPSVAVLAQIVVDMDRQTLCLWWWEYLYESVKLNQIKY